MARQATDTHNETVEYDHAPIPAADADLPDFGEPEASPVPHEDTADHASFEAHDFGGEKGR